MSLSAPRDALSSAACPCVAGRWLIGSCSANGAVAHIVHFRLSLWLCTLFNGCFQRRPTRNPSGSAFVPCMCALRAQVCGILFGGGLSQYLPSRLGQSMAECYALCVHLCV